MKKTKVWWIIKTDDGKYVDEFGNTTKDIFEAALCKTKEGNDNITASFSDKPVKVRVTVEEI